MKQPFEGLFGDTCETRLLQFLLPMYGIEFDMAELTEEILRPGYGEDKERRTDLALLDQ
jgi:hypothetical protein